MSPNKAYTLIAIAAAGLLSLGSARADDLQRVEVSGKPLAPVRHDVSRACPGVAASLQDSLAMVAWREGSAATVQMNFQLSGSRIEAVQAASGPFEYRRAARRAVWGLACADASTGQPQQFSFLIRFNPPEDDPAAAPASRVALLER